MKRWQFMEGFILGTFSGIVLGYLFSPSKPSTEKALSKVQKDEEDIKQSQAKTETMINKTLNAIESGFDKLENIIKKNENG